MSINDDLTKYDNEMESMILAVSSSYEKKYYLNDNFNDMPKEVKDELKIMCIMFTEEVGGILTLLFDDEGHLKLLVSAKETDAFFDDIGSELKVRSIQKEKRELLSSIEKYYRVVFLGEDI